MGRGRGEITQAMLTDRDFADEQVAALQAARRNAGRIRMAGPWVMLEILAAIADLVKTPERGERDESHED